MRDPDHAFGRGHDVLAPGMHVRVVRGLTPVLDGDRRPHIGRRCRLLGAGDPGDDHVVALADVGDLRSGLDDDAGGLVA